jgi:cell division protein FtsL
MRRNRKREPLRLGTVAKALGVCVCIAGTGLGYVWQKTQIYRLGDEIKRREATLLATQKRNSMLAAQLAYLKSPAQLEARCQQYGLALVAPREDQVVRLYEPGPEWDAPVTVASEGQPGHNMQTRTVAQR